MSFVRQYDVQLYLYESVPLDQAFLASRYRVRGTLTRDAGLSVVVLLRPTKGPRPASRIFENGLVCFTNISHPMLISGGELSQRRFSVFILL